MTVVDAAAFAPARVAGPVAVVVEFELVGLAMVPSAYP
jgi:hypothetical protein